MVKEKTIKVYEFEDLNDKAKEKVLDSFRNSDYPEYMYSLEEIILSLKAISKKFNFNLDYSLGYDRGTYVSVKNDFKGTTREFFKGYYTKNEAKEHTKGICPFTGMCYDCTFFDVMVEEWEQDFQDFLKEVGNRYLKLSFDEIEYHSSDSAIIEMVEANEYEFDENGKRI